MPQRIEVPGFGVVEFPDGMTDAQIASAIQANIPQSPANPAVEQAKATGPGEAFMVGAGSKVNDILNGITQMYLGARGEQSALGGLAQNVAEQKSIIDPLKQERPFSTGIGGALPAMAIPGAGASYGGAMLAGAIPELASYGSAQERLTKGAISAAGAAGGRALFGLLGRFLKPAGVGVNPNTMAMEAAQRIGFKPMAGQATQNPALLNIENYLARTSGSSGTMQAINQANQSAINKAAAESIGQNADEMSGALLNAAEKTIGSKFDKLQSITAPRLGNDFVNSLQKIEVANAARGSFRDPQIDKLLEKALDLAARGKLSGAAYKEIRTELSGQATKAFKAGDATLGQAVKTIRSSLDDAASQSLSKADQEAWKVARQQWGNWKVLTKGMVSEAGNVSPARVAAQLRAQGPAFRTGQMQGPLADVGRIGEGIKTALNPNSGNLPNTLPGLMMSPVNFAAAKAYTNPLVQKYLREGILDIGKNGELIIKATGVPLGVAATNNLLGVQ